MVAKGGNPAPAPKQTPILAASGAALELNRDYTLHPDYDPDFLDRED
jgi:hypothetical protein